MLPATAGTLLAVAATFSIASAQPAPPAPPAPAPPAAGAAAPAPPPAAGGIVGRIVTARPYLVQLLVPPSRYVTLHLRTGTVINPLGATLTPGMLVAVRGSTRSDGSIATDEIDVQPRGWRGARGGAIANPPPLRAPRPPAPGGAPPPPADGAGPPPPAPGQAPPPAPGQAPPPAPPPGR